MKSEFAGMKLELVGLKFEFTGVKLDIIVMMGKHVDEGAHANSRDGDGVAMLANPTHQPILVACRHILSGIVMWGQTRQDLVVGAFDAPTDEEDKGTLKHSPSVDNDDDMIQIHLLLFKLDGILSYSNMSSIGTG